MTERQKILLMGISWALLIAAVFHLYFPGLESGLHFDDMVNLGGLSGIGDFRSAAAFVLSGSAGPSGRPLALASFLPHASGWPLDLHRVILTNILLHLVNGLMVGLFAFLIAKQSPAFPLKERAGMVALSTAAIWLLLPLLASSNLFIVQRMTTLAAFFVLAGLSLHLTGRSVLPERRWVGLLLLTAGLGSGLGLGILSKENAAVYPLLILALDRTLLKDAPRPDLYLRWRMIFVVVPAILLAAYLISRLAGGLLETGTAYEQRHFSLVERVLTQGVILIDYLRLMLMPNPEALGLFHDSYPLYGGWPPFGALLALVAWISLITASVLVGPRWPIPAFAVLWFTAAHSLESTWLPLELYFEHRNYLPTMGVVLAFVFGLGQIAGRRGQLMYVGLGLYAAFLAFVLVQVTSLWGSPRVAAEVWYANNPSSSRAAQFLALQYEADGHPMSSVRTLQKTASLDERQLSVQLVSLRLTCVYGSDFETRQLFNQILERIPEAHWVNSQPTNDAKLLGVILNKVEAGECDALTLDDVDAMATAYLMNPIVQKRDGDLFNYYALMALSAKARGDALGHVELGTLALEHHPVMTSAIKIGEAAAEQGRTDLVHRILASVEGSRPRHPWKRQQWQDTVETLNGLLEKVSEGQRVQPAPLEDDMEVRAGSAG